MVPINPTLKTLSRKQRTLKQPVAFSGIGIHTGKQVTMRFLPAEEGTGIIFQRSDLPSKPQIPATIDYVRDTSRSTTIGIADINVHTVEHVLAALKAYDIDNVYVEVSDVEPPVGNGSSDIFVKMIEESGIKEQKQTLPIAKLKTPVYWSQGDIHLVALPYEGFRISYTLQYPDSQALKAQFHSLLVTSENFKREIAPCRTFSRYEEVSLLMDRGLIKGGSLANAVIIKEDIIFSKEGLYYPDEMVRHKVLDLIGDLTLVGCCFYAHVIAIRSGHASNFEFSKTLFNHIKMENK